MVEKFKEKKKQDKQTEESRFLVAGYSHINLRKKIIKLEEKLLGMKFRKLSEAEEKKKQEIVDEIKILNFNCTKIEEEMNKIYNTIKRKGDGNEVI